MTKKSTRVRSANNAIELITSFEQADEVLKQLGDLQLAINQAQITAKDNIDEAKAELAEAIKPLQEKIREKVTALEVFASANRNMLGKAQSQKLNFGTFGWRRSSIITIAKKTLERIKIAFSPKEAKTLIRTKEEVDKLALAKLTDEQLASIGARRKDKEVFFAEPDLPEAVDYE